MPVNGRRERYSVWLCDERAREAVPEVPVFRIVQRPRASTIRNLFVFCTAVQLPEVSHLVSTVNRRNQLRALFLREDANLAWLPQLLERGKLRAIRHLLVHSDLDMPRRVLTAWQFGAERRLIARAMTANDRLFVTSCLPETFEIEFDRMPALRRLRKRDRGNFVVSDDGSYIHWRSQDVHVDLDAILSVLDTAYGDTCAAARLAHHKTLGQAVAALRRRQGLRQAEVAGLSDRQVRRIETGGRATVPALKRLAAAHRMGLDEYLNALAAHIEAVDRDATSGSLPS